MCRSIVRRESAAKFSRALVMTLLSSLTIEDTVGAREYCPPPPTLLLPIRRRYSGLAVAPSSDHSSQCETASRGDRYNRTWAPGTVPVILPHSARVAIGLLRGPRRPLLTTAHSR
ncbi:hypothetical protein OH76DRAFT_796279 [Lentinus brumalis]|uniref:Secreted protein n=1 Tax=Lentinus brumalis TaxID=2498619 RepID=A0A371D3K4_9APHY|nr:hypothetical protein OH76DRAFT_796279 [Polyporus brumalis]